MNTCPLRQRQRQGNFYLGAIVVLTAHRLYPSALTYLSDQMIRHHTDTVFVRTHNCRLLEMSIRMLVLVPKIEYAGNLVFYCLYRYDTFMHDNL